MNDEFSGISYRMRKCTIVHSYRVMGGVKRRLTCSTAIRLGGLIRLQSNFKMLLISLTDDHRHIPVEGITTSHSPLACFMMPIRRSIEKSISGRYVLLAVIASQKVPSSAVSQ